MEERLKILIQVTGEQDLQSSHRPPRSVLRGLYKVTVEKKLEVLDQVPGRQYLRP
jgi:hypothetical protein